MRDPPPPQGTPQGTLHPHSTTQGQFQQTRARHTRIPVSAHETSMAMIFFEFSCLHVQGFHARALRVLACTNSCLYEFLRDSASFWEPASLASASASRGFGFGFGFGFGLGLSRASISA